MALPFMSCGAETINLKRTINSKATGVTIIETRLNILFVPPLMTVIRFSVFVFFISLLVELIAGYNNRRKRRGVINLRQRSA